MVALAEPVFAMLTGMALTVDANMARQKKRDFIPERASGKDVDEAWF